MFYQFKYILYLGYFQGFILPWDSFRQPFPSALHVLNRRTSIFLHTAPYYATDQLFGSESAAALVSSKVPKNAAMHQQKVWKNTLKYSKNSFADVLWGRKSI